MALPLLVVAVFIVTLMVANSSTASPRRVTAIPGPPVPSPTVAVFHAGSEPAPVQPFQRLRSRVTFCPILMFHYIRINPVQSDILGLHLSVTPAEFDAEMHSLRLHNFSTVTMSELAQHIRYGTPLPSKCVALTFDDGYEDQYTNAFPTLKRYGLTGTFFIVSGFADTPRYMTWRQIRCLDHAGMEIGVHTVTHPDLAILAPAQDLWEIHHSKMVIERHLGHPALVFAYPSGAYNQLVLDNVRKAGYLAAVSTDPGTLHSQATLNYLYRVRILDSDTPQTMYADLTTRFGNPYGPAPQLAIP